ncbi:MAG TPA: AAA family ATPase [Gaiellaceae bacterium]|nr:AAA family ATPase [Gaiellaceae bacterium]
MRRVAVIGPSCSGKTTTARGLAAILGVPHIELDGLHFGPNWAEASPELLQERVRAALDAASDGWVVDGNYFGKLGPLVLDRADSVVLLDVPHRTALGRVLRRTWSRLITREELWQSGNRERLRDTFGRESIVAYVLTQHRGFEQRWTERLEGRNVIRVTDAEAWLQSIQATESMSGNSNGRERQKTPPFAET